MSLSLSIDQSALIEAQKKLKGIQNGFPKAVSRSINSGLKAGRTEAAQLIRTRYNLKAAMIKSAMSLKNASNSGLEGELSAKGPMLPIDSFNRTVKVKNGLHYVHAAIIKGKQKLIKGAFIINRERTFHRDTDQRFPISPVMTIGVPFMIGSLNISEKIQSRMAEAYNTALKYNVNYYLQKG